MKYSIKAKPTMYRGVLFRSRLEAKWAAFFDNVGWHWGYEPCEFNGWFPDFAIYGSEGHIIYVEVKPICEFCKETTDKIDASGCVSDVILLGQICPIPNSDGISFTNNTVQLGWMREQYGSEDFQWAAAELGTWDDQIGFCNPEQGWTDPISGKYGKFYRKDITDFIYKSWGDACNKTQWEKR